MKNGPRSAGARQLEALRRWRSLELERAQSRWQQSAQAVDDRQRRLEDLSATIEQTQALARDLRIAQARLSVDALQRLATLAVHQARELEQAQQRLAQSRAELQHAQDVVLQRFEELAVVERLAARRAQEAGRLELQAQQKKLDEHAMVRTPSKHDTYRRSTHGS